MSDLRAIGIVVVACVLLPTITIAQSQAPSVPPKQIAPSPLKSAIGACMGASLMAFDDYHGPKAAIKPGAQAIMFACIIRQMPPDWDGRAQYLEMETSNYNAAKALDPNFPDPAMMFPPSKR